MTWLDALHTLGWISAVIGVACVLGGFVALIDFAVKRGAEYGANKLPSLRIRIPKQHHHDGILEFNGPISDDALKRLKADWEARYQGGNVVNIDEARSAVKTGVH